MANSKKKLMVTAVAAGLLAFSYAGSADAEIFIGFGAPAPYYVAPAPVVYASPPVSYVVQAPAVVAVPSYPVYAYYGGPRYHYWHHEHHWERHGHWR